MAAVCQGGVSGGLDDLHAAGSALDDDAEVAGGALGTRAEGQQCRLTSTGRNALQGDNYARAMSTHLAIYLKNQAGITYSDLKDTIAAIQR